MPLAVLPCHRRISTAKKRFSFLIVFSLLNIALEHNMFTTTDWIFLLILTVSVIQLVLSLRPFFAGKLIVYLVALTMVLAAVPNVAISTTSTSLAVAACYIGATVISSTLMWDSRQFIIDNFSFVTFLLSRPVVVLVPLLLVLIGFDVIPLKRQVCIAMLAVQILIAAVLSEAVYSVAKRNDWLLRRRRSSLPRMETMSGTTPTNQTIV